MSHIAQEKGTDAVCNFSESWIIKVLRISTSSCDNHRWLELSCLYGKRIHINQTSSFDDVVGLRLEVQTCSRNFLEVSIFICGLMSMSQMTAMWKSEAHDSVTRLQQSGVHLEVSWRARERLHVDVPLFLRELESRTGSVLADALDLVDKLVSSVISVSWSAFGILVCQARSKSLHHRLRGEVFTGNQLKATELSIFLLFDKSSDFRICLGEAKVWHRKWFFCLHFQKYFGFKFD